MCRPGEPRCGITPVDRDSRDTEAVEAYRALGEPDEQTLLRVDWTSESDAIDDSDRVV